MCELSVEPKAMVLCKQAKMGNRNEKYTPELMQKEKERLQHK